MAVLKRPAAHSKFDAVITDTVCDRQICGLCSEAVPKGLLSHTKRLGKWYLLGKPLREDPKYQRHLHGMSHGRAIRQLSILGGFQVGVFFFKLPFFPKAQMTFDLVLL